jgi:hypothetical protein
VIRSDELIGEQVLAKVGGLILIIAYVWSVKGTLRCIRAYVDGQMDLVAAVVMSEGYILVSGLIGFAWGTFYQKTDSLWAPWSTHALNNTVMNFLQITTGQIGHLDAEELPPPPWRRPCR